MYWSEGVNNEVGIKFYELRKENNDVILGLKLYTKGVFEGNMVIQYPDHLDKESRKALAEKLLEIDK